MNEAIRAWLNSTPRKWAPGVELYLKYGKDSAFAQRLQGTETDTLKKQLFSALKDLLQPGASPAPDVPDAAPKIPVKEETEVTLELKRTADKLYQEMRNARAELLSVCTKEESPADKDPAQKKIRADLARKVIGLQYKIDGAYDDYRYALEHGQPRIKDALATEPVSALDLHRIISNLRKRISKLKNGEQTVRTDELLAEKKSLLKQYLEEYGAAKACGL